MATQDEISISLLMLVGTGGMILLALGVLFFFINYKRKLIQNELDKQLTISELHAELAKSIIETQEEERKRFAADLHDQIGASLSTARLQISLIERKTNDIQKLVSIARETRNILDDVIQDVRRISKDLVPPTIEEFGLKVAIQELAKKINSAEQIEVIIIDQPESNPHLDAKQELSIYRIIQEIINNAIKHSGASKLTIDFKLDNNFFYISISDNGIGFNANEITKGKGLGLKNIESRINLLQGSYKLQTEPEKGTKWLFLIPLKLNNDGQN